MSKTTELHQWGYRLSDGTEAWESDHGTDGSWIKYDFQHKIAAVDIYDDGSEAGAIYHALDQAGVEGVAVRRRVTRTEEDAETMPRLVTPGEIG